jgi:hypothetical protein
MNGKKYLIYLDILGFEGLAKEMAEGTIFEEDQIRQDYLSAPLEKKIEELKREIIQIPNGISEIEGSDNYVLIVDNIQTAFELVGKLTTIKIPHKDHEFIPFEVALGTKKIDEGIEVKPINRKEIIKFLKEDVITPYRSYYKNKNDETPKETFVLFTQEFFDDLEPLDKKYCERISYNKTFFVADLEKIQQRARIFEFLEKIGYSGSKLYDRIDEVYVPPSEYEDIAKTLKENRILFITGTPEYGKTYTAVRLLWDYYKRGYEPRWIRGGNKTERNEVGRKLEDIGSELKHGRIIYFEDPFGQIEYEERYGLERGIGTIKDSVRQVEGAYVIITSREEVFKEFKKEKPSVKELKEFEEKLNIKKPSYNYEKREEILLNWAEGENCKWLRNEKLKNLVLESMKDEKILPTPLSIKNFARATFDVEDEDELKREIKEKSVETAKAFAKEIKNMTDDKILFLSLLYIFESGPYIFEAEFVRTTYQEMVEELNLQNTWEFDRVVNWFKDDKIKIDTVYGSISFSHPSYSEALCYLLIEDGYPTRINREIFSELLLKLSERSSIAQNIAWVVAKNYDMLPDEVGDLLFKISKIDDAAFNLAWDVYINFDKLPEDVRNKLLLKLSEKDETAWVVAEAVADNFDKLPEVVRNLLFKLSEKEATAVAVAKAVASNFDKLPVDVRNELLLKISANSEAVAAIKLSLVINFDKLPEHVRNSFDIPKPLQQLIEDLPESVEPRTEVGKLLNDMSVDSNGG